MPAKLYQMYFHTYPNHYTIAKSAQRKQIVKLDWHSVEEFGETLCVCFQQSDVRFERGEVLHTKHTTHYHNAAPTLRVERRRPGGGTGWASGRAALNAAVASATRLVLLSAAATTDAGTCLGAQLKQKTLAKLRDLDKLSRTRTRTIFLEQPHGYFLVLELFICLNGPI